MKCPNCGKTTELYKLIPSGTHLTVGDEVQWCPRCGTVCTITMGAVKARDIKVPWVSDVDK